MTMQLGIGLNAPGEIRNVHQRNDRSSSPARISVGLLILVVARMRLVSSRRRKQLPSSTDPLPDERTLGGQCERARLGSRETHRHRCPAGNLDHVETAADSAATGAIFTGTCGTAGHHVMPQRGKSQNHFLAAPRGNPGKLLGQRPAPGIRR